MKGISIIGTIFTMIILGVMGMTLVSLVATQQTTRMQHIHYERAFYAVQAGFEYGLREIMEGGYPLVVNKPFENSQFTVLLDIATHEMTVTATDGTASKAHRIVVNNLANDCSIINTSGATATGPGQNTLEGITVTQNCLNAITIDLVTLTWNPDSGERVRRIAIGGNEVYNDPLGLGSGVAIDIANATIAGTVPINLIEFSAGLSGKAITLTLTFSDSSSKISIPILIL